MRPKKSVTVTGVTVRGEVKSVFINDSWLPSFSFFHVMIVACVFATHVEQQQCVTGKLPIRMKKSKISVLLKGTERNKMMNGQNRRLIHRRNCFEGPNRPNPDLY